MENADTSLASFTHLGLICAATPIATQSMFSE